MAPSSSPTLGWGPPWMVGRPAGAKTSARVLAVAGRFMHRDPILVCGVPRTGTSWVAKVLSLGGMIRYVREPISQGPLADREPGSRFRYLAATEDDAEYAALWREALCPGTLARKRWLMSWSRPWLRRVPFWPARLLVKEVDCPLALEWLAEHFGLRVVITIRHPCGFVASALRLGKLNHPAVPLERLLDQPRLMADYFPEERGWLAGLRDPVARIAAAYGMVYKVVGEQLMRHPEWILVHHESLCEAPAARFRKLFDAVGIPYQRRVDEYLAETSQATDGEPYSLLRRSPEEPGKWRHELSAGQIETVGAVISRLRLPFYRAFA